MLHLTTKQKKEVFKNAWKRAKDLCKQNESFIEEVFNQIEDTYDKLDPEYGFNMNEQWEFDKNWSTWAKEMK